MSPRHFLSLAAATALLWLSACAGELQLPLGEGDNADPDTPSEPAPVLPGPGGAQSRFATGNDGLYTGVINATGSDWVYINLHTQTQVQPDDPAHSDAWDIAFLGSEIKLNGGSSGAPPSHREVKIYGDKSAEGGSYPFAQITAAPTETAVDYQTDRSSSSANPLNSNPEPVYAFSTVPEADQAPNALTGAGDYGWYHDAGLLGGNAITPRGNVAYVISATQCQYYKLRFTAYNDSSGATGHPAFEFVSIPGANCAASSNSTVAPLGRAVFSSQGNSQIVAVDATDENAWVHLDLSNAMQVSPSTPNNDPLGWDIALKRTDIKVNGGTSGTGVVAIADGLRDSWDARVAAYADTSRYHTDASDALAFITYPAAERTGDSACGGINSDFGWYYYSGFCNDGEGVHHISPRDVVYVVKGRNGQYWKLRMLDYYDAAGSSAHPSLEFAPVTPP
jgi:hypothetical protein